MIDLDSTFGAMIGDSGSKVLGLGVVVFKDGKQAYSFFGGRRRINPDKPVNRDTLFRSASLSKMFTAFAIMQLVECGKLSLTDDVGDWLGFELRNPRFPATPITIEMLASHTSSLRDGNAYNLPPCRSVEEFFREGGKHFANTRPGKFFGYCNLNYGLLGTIIERVTGKRFDVYQRENILDPLDIGGGYVVGNLSDSAFEKLGSLYQRQGGSWKAQIDDYAVKPRRDTVRDENPYRAETYATYSLDRYVTGTNATVFSPSGGLRISFGGLSHCLDMLINRGKFGGRQVIGEKSFDTMTAAHWTYDSEHPNGNTYGGVMENYGLGTYRLGGESRARPCKDYAIDLIGHSGEAFGLISGLYFVPGTRDGFAFMINGRAIGLDDKGSCGEYSANYIWEEGVMNPVCRYIKEK